MSNELTAAQLAEMMDSGELQKIAQTLEASGTAAITMDSAQPQPVVEEISDASKSASVSEHALTSERVVAPVGNTSTPLTLEPQRDCGFDIKDPVELLFLLDDDIREGRVKLHKWQVQFMLDFAHEAHDKDSPFVAQVRAANGSGKDKYVVAACGIWLCMRYLQSRCVMTNGSGDQLDNQTEVYVDQLARKCNEKIAPNIWKCNYRYYECLATGSPVKLFATDEPNKAEGYHPLAAGGKLAIFASEAKAIPDDIFSALTRCTGVTHRVNVSSPGLRLGYFYDKCMSSVPRSELDDIKSIESTQSIHYHITAFDCPHITKEEIEAFAADLPGGKTSQIYLSGIMAEFGGTEEMVVIPDTYLWRAVYKTSNIKHIEEPYNKGGLDLSDGGAETVLAVRNGNKLLKVIPFKFDNTEDTITFLEEKFEEHNLTHPESYIFGDAVGIGKPMLDRLKRKGWSNIRYFDSRNTAYNPRTYKNRNSESWFHFRILLERNELILFYEKTLYSQLAARYYKITPGNIHQLLSKIEQRSKGYPSPDRADAVILAFLDYKSTFKETEPVKDKPFVQPLPPKQVHEFTLQEYVKREDNGPYTKTPSRNIDFSEIREQLKEYNQHGKH